MTLTSAPVSTRKRKRLALSVIKNRRLGGRPEVLVANSTRPGRFPTKNRGCALLGLVPKAAMVPATSLGWEGEEAREAVRDRGLELEQLVR